MARPSLLFLTTFAAGTAMIANGVSAASPDGQDSEAKTRLGTSITRDLGARDAAEARRKRKLDMRETATAAAEARLKAEMEARGKAEAAATKAGEASETPVDAQFDELARIYQAMKPAKAARVFEQLTIEVQVKVARRMRDRSTAAILAGMSPEAAAALSMALAEDPRKAFGASAGGRPPRR